GYAVLEGFKYKYKSKSDRKLRRQLDILYGEKYAEYYLRVIHSQQITLAFTLFVFSFPLYGLTSEVLALIIGFVFAGLSYYYFGTITKKRIMDRSDELLHDFSEVVSKLALLTNAGMILREAWEEVAYAGSTLIYQEMQTAVNEMNNGVPEIDAIFNFGSRCVIPEIKKFTSTIIQGITKGNRELSEMLHQQSKEVWQLKKQLVRREGEKAASKLLIPISIMFLGILLMILVPVFTNLGT
ncbi:MAG: pilus assembly protein TadC, partial [Clostridiales bacterium]|nr:pilus assembly protein TadC [Clostridiales bacterium]